MYDNAIAADWIFHGGATPSGAHVRPSIAVIVHNALNASVVMESDWPFTTNEQVRVYFWLPSAGLLSKMSRKAHLRVRSRASATGKAPVFDAFLIPAVRRLVGCRLPSAYGIS
jgi:hypothetical protein